MVDGQASESQMKALYGEGLHPDADARIEEALSRGVDREAAVAAVRLGRRFPMIDQSHEVWRDALNAAYGEFEAVQGRGESNLSLVGARLQPWARSPGLQVS